MKLSRDELFAEAGCLIIRTNRAYIAWLQHFFKIRFGRAFRIMEQLTEAGVVDKEPGAGPREILMTAEEFEPYLLSPANSAREMSREKRENNEGEAESE